MQNEKMMQRVAHTMNLRFHTDPLTMRMARKQAGAAAKAVGAGEYDAGRIELAVAEALSNAHEHAYEGGSGPVELEIVYEPGYLTLTVSDEGNRTGAPFDLRFPDPPPPRLGDGYGLQVIKSSMDEAEFVRSGPEGRGTTIRMAMRLK